MVCPDRELNLIVNKQFWSKKFLERISDTNGLQIDAIFKINFWRYAILSGKQE